MSTLNPKQKLIQVNSSSIVDLKAELSRKQELVRQKNQKDDTPTDTDSNLYATVSVNPSLPKRLRQNLVPEQVVDNKRVKKEERREQSQQEILALQKSREALERKTKLYEQMSKGTVPVDRDDENILVNFDQKHRLMSDSDDDDQQDEDLVEYVDQFGRTRMVTRRQLEQFEKERAQEEDDEEDEIGPRFEDMENPSQSDSPPRSPPPSNVHYQHVREGEVRDHGVAFYSFSGDEETRAKQMEMLSKLRKETEAVKKEKQRIKEKRKDVIRNRLEKIAARKGLTLPPPKPEEPGDEPEPVITVERATLKPKPASHGPREWDLGKEGLHAINPPARRPFYSPERYKEKMRNERNPEFAPPQIYSSSNRNFTTRKTEPDPEPEPSNSFTEDDLYSMIHEIKKNTK